jgi:hypothetical protein
MDYHKVIEDFANGTLDKDHVTVVMDNDGGYWNVDFPDKSDDENDELRDQYINTYGEPEGYRDIVDILIAAGVNCEWC